jgi:antitoxin VapB
VNTARLFTHGGSQALRLPKEYRFEGTQVHIRRVGQDVVLSPMPAPGVQGLIDALAAFEPGVRIEREATQADEREAIEPRR